MQGIPPCRKLFAALLDLSLDAVDGIIYGLLEGAGLRLGAQVATGYVHRDYCNLITLLGIFVELEHHLGTRRLCKSLQLCHLGLDKLDELLAGIEFHGLNLYVHSLLY